MRHVIVNIHISMYNISQQLCRSVHGEREERNIPCHTPSKRLTCHTTRESNVTQYRTQFIRKSNIWRNYIPSERLLSENKIQFTVHTTNTRKYAVRHADHILILK